METDDYIRAIIFGLAAEIHLQKYSWHQVGVLSSFV